MTLFFQQLGVWEAPAKVTPIGAAEDLSPGPEVGPPHPGAGTSQRLFAETLTSRSI
jgi:hypothetical protein